MFNCRETAKCLHQKVTSQQSTGTYRLIGAQAVRQNFCIVMHSNHTLNLTGAGLVLLLVVFGVV